MASKNIVWHRGLVSREDRTRLLGGRKNKVLWFTGLSGSGKSTIAALAEKKMHDAALPTYILDGDNIRHGLNSELGFSPKDREENIRRIGEVARILHDAGIFVLVCFISPYERDRLKARGLIGDDFIEIYVRCPVEECEKRDSKGMYKKAKQGKIKDFTGVSAPYEEPKSPEMILDSGKDDAETCARHLLESLKLG